MTKIHSSHSFHVTVCCQVVPDTWKMKSCFVCPHHYYRRAERVDSIFLRKVVCIMAPHCRQMNELSTRLNSTRLHNSNRSVYTLLCATPPFSEIDSRHQTGSFIVTFPFSFSAYSTFKPFPNCFLPKKINQVSKT